MKWQLPSSFGRYFPVLARLRAQGLLVAIGLMLCCAGVWAQSSMRGLEPPWGKAARYVNIIKSRVERLSNAVRITLEADGVLETDIDVTQFWERDPETGWWEERDLKHMSINLLNARSQIGRYVDVGMYPASHLTLSVPPKATEGVGLVVTLALYVPARLGKFQLEGGVRDWSSRDQTYDRRVDMVLSENQRELIITVRSDQYVEVGKEKEAEVGAPAGPLVLEAVGAGYRLAACRVPLGQVLDEISQATGTPIVVSPGLDRRLTANLPPLPTPKLLQTICDVLCLQLTARDGTYFVSQGTVEEIRSYWGARSRQIHLQSLPVAEALLLLPSFVLKHVQINEASNTLVAYGPPALLDKLAADLRAVDEPGRQIRLAAMIVETRADRHLERALDVLIEGGNTSVDLASSQGRIWVGVVDHSLEHIRAKLLAFQRGNDIEVDVRPETTVLSGRRARLFVGQQQYYRFVRRRWYGPQVEMRKVDVGISLEVQPWTGDGRRITVPFSVASDTVISRDAEGLPLVSRQKASGNLRITSGDTIMFGGLRSRETYRQAETARPITEFPAFGSLLEDRRTVTQDRDVVICLSAETLRAGNQG